MPIYSSLLDDLDKHPERFDILAAASRINRPWLIIHGEEDTSVSPRYALDLKNTGKHQLLTISQANHVFNAKHPWSDKSLPMELRAACDATINFFRG